MDEEHAKAPVLVSLSQDEAVVLLSWLAASESLEDRVDEVVSGVLWNIEGQLEKSVNSVFQEDFQKQLQSSQLRLSKR